MTRDEVKKEGTIRERREGRKERRREKRRKRKICVFIQSMTAILLVHCYCKEVKSDIKRVLHFLNSYS